MARAARVAIRSRVGFEWASRVTTIALGFSVPALIGFGLDRWLRIDSGRDLGRRSFWALYRGCFRRSGSREISRGEAAEGQSSALGQR